MWSVEPAPVLTPEALTATATAIAAVQEPDGAIPWYPGGHTDPWDHLECAMALELGGRRDAADAAWDWLCRNQRADGSWATSYVAGTVKEDFADSNQCAYVATATWHRWLATRDRAFVARMWPVVRRALDFVVDLQAPTGQIRWARAADGSVHADALLTGCSSTLLSLRCGMALAALVDEVPAAWGRAAAALRHAIVAHPDYFIAKDRWSMDWYYPVIGGAFRGGAGRARLSAEWDDFVVDGLGIRCVRDEPWVTGAETCELAIALHLVGESVAAVKLLGDMQHLRHPEGSYWTGWQFENRTFWPAEQSTWTAAAVILATDTLAGGVTEKLFRAVDLPDGVPIPDVSVLDVPILDVAVPDPRAGGSAPADHGRTPITSASAPSACGCGSGGPAQDPQRSCV